ncbi:Imm64 family immunity protein [Halalkalibacter sp. APA_J-10(15)]|uniref:Imm64 family immunity protein n=1 Tax=Halalkalibacter sp. APA_J-10(15) TaxID=2933805 RepID=UPI001FF42755|nr:Imm64 family immunity protein [Halalkalibacter sp. APA_J-10(15)]MCK0470383.1 Imm64 family immunity protein [Halalkalibacter sp. APA_J-10(15)]
MPIGGYINIAQVYIDKRDMFSNLKYTLNFLIKEGSVIRTIKYREDSENLIEIKDNDDLQLPTEWNYLMIEITGEAFQIEGDFSLTVFNENGFYGFLYDIEWEGILNDGDSSDVHLITEELLRVLIKLYNYTKYNYCLVGHELEIEIHPNELQRVIEDPDVMPVSIVEKNNLLEVYYGNYSIDGITEQEKKRKSIKI